MRTIAITSLIALGSTLCAGGPSADQLAGLMKAGAAIQDGASITTRFGGSTVSVTRQNGVVTCTVDGKPIALRVSGPAPKPAALTPVVVALTQSQQANLEASLAEYPSLGEYPSFMGVGNPLFQNPLIWISRPNPNPPSDTFEPLADLPGFIRPLLGWMADFEFEACVLGLSSVGNGQTVLGPYGTSTSSFGNNGCS